MAEGICAYVRCVAKVYGLACVEPPQWAARPTLNGQGLLVPGLRLPTIASRPACHRLYGPGYSKPDTRQYELSVINTSTIPPHTL